VGRPAAVAHSEINGTSFNPSMGSSVNFTLDAQSAHNQNCAVWLCECSSMVVKGSSLAETEMELISK
jgi:hypothetical protein